MRLDERPKGSDLRKITPYIDLGLRFALSLLIAVYAGYWVDSRLSTTPLFLVLGMLIGGLSGFLTIYRAAFPRKKNKSESEDFDARK